MARRDRLGRCVECGRKAPTTRKRQPVIVVQSRDRKWRVLARPHSYRIQHLERAAFLATPRSIYKDIQKIFRTHNKDIPQEIDAACAAMERRRIEFEESLRKQEFFDEPAVVPQSWVKKFLHEFTATVTKEYDRAQRFVFNSRR